ncbi:MAG: hypothetical protein HY899_10580 [Deltaproteobacteria bacterium]|nr:hypothetical protein [Deltaproteobacteria bacterium]
MPRLAIKLRRRCTAVCLIAALAVVAGVMGCGREARYRTLNVLFEGVPPPGEEVANQAVVRRPRRLPPPAPAVIPADAPPPLWPAAGLAPLRTWDDVVRLLPKDQAGNPDWTGAIEEKVIAPRSVLDLDAAESEAITLDALESATVAPDVDLVSKSDPAFDVTFSHRKHGAWLTCANCHPAPFQKKAGSTPMSAADVHTQKYCAVCHGRVAFDIGPSCLSCHLRTMPHDAAGQVDWNRALETKRIAPRAGRGTNATDQEVLQLDIKMTPPAQPALESVFSHSAHTQWIACASCHPDPYSAKVREAMTDTAELHSARYCGSCHGTVSFGITGFCGRCHPALEKARQHQEVIDLDVPVAPKPQTGGATTLSHKQHRWVECATCHDNLFTSTPGATTMPKADIYGGKYCATCHGKVTGDLIASCRRCHSSGSAP